jgi:glucuronate isomerase
MAGELAVTRERLDTVERLLAERQLLDRQLIDAYRPDAAAAEERGRWQLEYIARLLRVLQQEVEAMQRNSP